MMEAGVPGYDFTTWYALVVPAATPQAIVDRVNRELRQIAQTSTVREQFAAQGLETAHTSAAEARAYLALEVAKWAKVIKASGARPE
jgi:tripartite-type tricarboxylate transporter receptor subunit TctC